jgi:hypothetical protein
MPAYLGGCRPGFRLCELEPSAAARCAAKPLAGHPGHPRPWLPEAVKCAAHGESRARPVGARDQRDIQSAGSWLSTRLIGPLPTLGTSSVGPVQPLPTPLPTLGTSSVGPVQPLPRAAASTSSHTAGIPVSSAARWVNTTTVRSCAGTFDHTVPNPPSHVYRPSSSTDTP